MSLRDDICLIFRKSSKNLAGLMDCAFFLRGITTLSKGDEHDTVVTKNLQSVSLPWEPLWFVVLDQERPTAMLTEHAQRVLDWLPGSPVREDNRSTDSNTLRHVGDRVGFHADHDIDVAPGSLGIRAFLVCTIDNLLGDVGFDARQANVQARL
jgi:hypothetical protein